MTGVDLVMESNETATINRSVVYRIVKRFFDVVLSIIGLIVLSPVFLITAIAIKLEDQGPVFFSQQRAGLGGQVFSMLKFRSMKVGADKMQEDMKKEYDCNEVSFKLKEDPRETKVGTFIRKTNIDEFPQLFNILKGEMSFVGPRPLPMYEYEVEQYKYKDKHKARYMVPQGLTCIWQISNRSATGFEKRMQMDVEYAENCGLGMDVKLFFQTALFALIGKVSY